jgi:asparagine synthase (glutamine-hydrolysing)
MCGVIGYIRFDDKKIEVSVLHKMTDVIIHRGPDNGATKIIKNVGLGHRRLSIIDLSNEANQPMETSDQRYTIVFNGEIYNFIEIRTQLENSGIQFSTNSDTEVILKSFEKIGTDCFKSFNGMFSVAIYDSHKEVLILARDQFGMKPLYYFKNDDFLAFSSEMKAIIEHPEVNLSISKQGLTEYIWYGNPLGNNTIYEQINELGAGCFMKINGSDIEINKYFNINSIKEKSMSEDVAIKEITRLFEESIKRHLISDVPVGIFLSGGIDSSAITAIASKHYKGKLKTYSVGFDFSKGPNELELAAEIAKKYNTDHHEIHITGENLIETIEKLVEAHDEPFGDAADIPLYLMSKQLKGEVKVVLQGDGGDEFFGGYSRYSTFQNRKKWNKLSFLPSLIELSKTDNPKFLRFQRFIHGISEKNPSTRNALMLTMESKYSAPLNIFNKKYRNLLEPIDPFYRYKEVYSQFPYEFDPIQALFKCDSQIILKDTFFEKVDKSTMANSMEVRLPFLDKDLTEFMLSIPSGLKVKNGINKYLFKKAMEGIVPDNVLYGKKTGFSVPYGYWLRTSLSDYFIHQISTEKASEFLDKTEIIRMFSLHKKEKGNYGYLLWKTLILAIWLNKQK